MAIKDLPKYKDIRSTIRRNGRYPIAKAGTLTGTAAKDTAVVHHSMTPQAAKGSTPAAFANTHIDTNGLQGIAYTFVIMPDGTIYQTDDLDRRTNHAGNTNDRSIGICVVGDFRTEGANEKPTEAQKLSLYLLVKELKKELPKLTRVIGHQECPGYAWKNCPGNTWNYKDVIAGKGIYSQKDWVKGDNKWFFYKEGKKLLNEWVKDKEKWYYLDANGVMKTGWVKWKDKWYFLNSKGEMLTGLIMDKGKLYYLYPDGSMAANTRLNVSLNAGPDGDLRP